MVWAEAEPGGLPAGLGSLVDVAVVSADSLGQLRAVRDLARADGAARVVAAVEVVLDAGGRDAADRLAALDAHEPWPVTGRIRLTGPPGAVADGLARVAELVDGIRLHPAVIDADAPAVAEHVLPLLDTVIRRPAPGDTLRGLFGLTRPENVFALGRSAR